MGNKESTLPVVIVMSLRISLIHNCKENGTRLKCFYLSVFLTGMPTDGIIEPVGCPLCVLDKDNSFGGRFKIQGKIVSKD